MGGGPAGPGPVPYIYIYTYIYIYIYVHTCYLYCQCIYTYISTFYWSPTGMRRRRPGQKLNQNATNGPKQTEAFR